jgi:4-hydroxybenzoate polyprenyltransferase
MRKIIEKMENAPTSFSFWLSSFSAIIIIRLLVENWLAGLKNRSGLFLFYEFTHNFLFFITAYILFLWILKKFLKVELKKISNILLWGYLVIILPPILDYLISRGKGYWSFYDFGSLKNLSIWFFTFFDKTPEIGITYGVRIEVAIALIFIFLYSLIKLSGLNNAKCQMPNVKSSSKSKVQNNFSNLRFKIWDFIGNLDFGFWILKTKDLTKPFLKSLGITITAYFIFYILGTFPSWITIAARGISKGFLSITEINVAQMFLTPATVFSKEISDIASSLNIKMSLVYALFAAAIILIGLYYNYRKNLISFVKNARFPQLIYHAGLLAVGMGAGMVFTKNYPELNFFNSVAFLVSLLAVACAWLASVVVNDLEDKEIDKITPNKNRPLITGDFSDREYKMLGIILFLSSLLFSAIVNFKITLLLIVYQAIAWIYSAWPLRLKRFAFISTFVSALASLLIFFSGYILVSPEQNLSGLPFSIIILLVLGYTFSLPIKDFKDIEGDKKEGVYTIPVLFGEEWGKIIVGGGIFLSFVLSVLIFNEFRLFWWALIFGGISFWLVINKQIKPAKLPWWILGTVSLYGLILVKIIFL